MSTQHIPVASDRDNIWERGDEIAGGRQALDQCSLAEQAVHRRGELVRYVDYFNGIPSPGGQGRPILDLLNLGRTAKQ